MTNDFLSAEALLRARLRAIDSRSDAGNGTLLADAAASLIAADAVAARASVAGIAGLPEDTLVEALTSIHHLLATAYVPAFTLPFGTRASSTVTGSAVVAGQSYVLVAQRDGMMREEEAPLEFEGLNLDHLLRLIDRRSRRLACRALGRPRSIVEDGRFMSHWLRFDTCEAAGGVSLEINLGGRPIAWSTHDHLVEVADYIVLAMQRFWRMRRDIAARATEAAEVFALVVAAAGSDADGVAVTGVVARPFQALPDEQIGLDLLVTTFDEALRPTIARWDFNAREQGADILRHIRRGHAWCLGHVAQPKPIEIDELAAAIVEAAPGGGAAVLSRLESALATDVVLPLDGQRSLIARLYWSCGMIDADLYPGGKVEHSSNRFSILDGGVPETIADSLVGRSIGDIIELPMACPFPIRSVERQGKRRLDIYFHTEVRHVDLAAGTIGPIVTDTQPAMAA